MTSIDPRIVRVSIEANNQLRTYENLAITVSGQKFANPNQGECNVTIANLDKEVADFILTETSPFNRNRSRKSIVVSVGRRSYGVSTLYQGDIYRSQGGVRPDNILTMRCLTGQFMKGNIVSRSGQGSDSLRAIARGVAADNGLNLQFIIPDKRISNYSFTGSAINQVENLRELSGADVFIDGQTLIMKPKNAPLPGSVFRVDRHVGLKVPQFTEQGIKVEFLYDPSVKLGSTLEVVSDQFPASNGRYVIYKLGYSIANREAPFHYIAECRRL